MDSLGDLDFRYALVNLSIRLLVRFWSNVIEFEFETVMIY